MELLQKLKTMVPNIIKKPLSPIVRKYRGKYYEELKFWRARFADDDGQFKNNHFQRVMLGIAERQNADFLKDSVVADFGCGPRGSLVWAKPAKIKIGIDILSDLYVDNFSNLCELHGMIYLKSTEKVIPMPDNFVDFMFSLNAIDHVDDFEGMCDEIIRVMKPGGELIVSFNMEEPATVCEPNRLTEDLIKRALLEKLETISYRISAKGPKDDQYRPFFEDKPLTYVAGSEGYLWVRLRKPNRG